MISLVLIGIALLLWRVTRDWEWNLPPFIQAVLIEGQKKLVRTQPYIYIWKIDEDDFEVKEIKVIREIKEIKLRKKLIELQKEKRVPLELKLYICSDNLDKTYYKILERRFCNINIYND